MCKFVEFLLNLKLFDKLLICYYLYVVPNVCFAISLNGTQLRCGHNQHKSRSRLKSVFNNVDFQKWSKNDIRVFNFHTIALFGPFFLALTSVRTRLISQSALWGTNNMSKFILFYCKPEAGSLLKSTLEITHFACAICAKGTSIKLYNHYVMFQSIFVFFGL